MNKKGFAWIIVIVVIALLVVAAAVWHFVQNRSSSVGSYDLIPSAYPTSSTATTSATPAVMGWKTYTNQQSDFSFRYPSTLFIIPVGSSSSIILSSNATSSGLEAEYAFSASMINNPNHLSIQQYFSNDTYDNGADLYANATVSTTTVDALPAIVFNGSTLYNMTDDEVIVIPYLNGFLEIVNNNLDESTFDAILKTLAFGCVPSSCWGHLGCNYYTCTDGTTKFVY